MQWEYRLLALFWFFWWQENDFNIYVGVLFPCIAVLNHTPLLIYGFIFLPEHSRAWHSKRLSGGWSVFVVHQSTIYHQYVISITQKFYVEHVLTIFYTSWLAYKHQAKYTIRQSGEWPKSFMHDTIMIFNMKTDLVTFT